MAAVINDHRRGSPTIQQKGQSLSLRQQATGLYGVLAGWTLFVLRHFLPSQRHFFAGEVRTLPIEVQDRVSDAFEMNIFTQITYWRPEGNSFGYRWRRRVARLFGGTHDVLKFIDPAMVGQLDYQGTTSYHVIAHWDPSGAPVPTTQQMSWHLIKERVKTVFFLDLPSISLITGVIVGICYGMVCAARAIFSLYQYGMSTVGAIWMVVLGITSIPFIIFGAWLIHHELRNSQLLADAADKFDLWRDQLLNSINSG